MDNMNKEEFIQQAVNEKIQSERQQDTNRKKKQYHIQKGLHR